MIFVCYIIEYFPVIAFKQRSKTKSKQMVEYSNDSQFNRVHGTMLLREIILRTHDKIESSDYPFLDDLLTILTNPECFYNVLYLIVSVLSLIWHMFYGLLLLDIIKRNSDLSNVLKSISLN